MAQEPIDSSSEGPVTTDEEQEELMHQIEMNQLKQTMKLCQLHRKQKKKRNHKKEYKSRIPSLRNQTKQIIIDTFRHPSLATFIQFNKNKTFTFRGYTFKSNILKPYLSITWKKDAYLLKIQISRSMAPIMRWGKRYLATYHSWQQIDSKYYYKDLDQELLDQIHIIKFEFVKHFLAMLINSINTPIGPILYFKYDKTIKDKQIDAIINELKQEMVRKIQMRKMGIVLSP
eukprot:77711_1